jgi:hypothetical protein
MSERPSQPEPLLTEIDRKLRAIQAELAPGRASQTAANGHQAQSGRGRDGPLATILEREPIVRMPAATVVAPTEATTPASTPAREPESEREYPSPEVAAIARQVESMAEAQARLIAASERLLDRLDRLASGASVVTMSAGPFGETEALREFERTIAELPGVGHVAVRGYEGADRAVLDVELGQIAPERDAGPPPSDATP